MDLPDWKEEALEALAEWQEEEALEALSRSDLRKLEIQLEGCNSTGRNMLSEETCGSLGSNSSLVSLMIRCRFPLVCTEALGEALRRNSSLQELEVSALGLVDAANLVRGLWGNSSLRRLTLRDRKREMCHFGESGVPWAKALGKALRTKVSLAMLHRFFDDKIGPDAVMKLGEALLSRSTLQVLELDCDIREFCATELGQGLRHNASLRELHLARSELGDTGVIPLAQALEVNSSLQSLDVRYSGIGSVGAAALAQSLRVNASLQALDLRGNRFGPEGAVALSQALQVNASLLTLDLSVSGIGSDGAAALAQALEVNASLRTLHLLSNQIGPEGALPLAQALQVNASLQALGLDCNPVGSEGAAALAQALQVNDVLRTLELRFNRIGPSGAVALAQALQINTSLQALTMHEDEGVMDAEAVMALRQAHSRVLWNRN